MPRTLQTGSEINNRIRAIKQSSAALANEIHDTAVQCLMHAEKHGDPRPMDNLARALGVKHRAESLKTWAMKFSPIRWNGDGKVGILPERAKAYTPYAIDDADAEPYWDTQQEAKAKAPLTLEALQKIVDGMAKKVQKAAQSGEYEGDLDTLNAYVVSLKAVTVPAPKMEPANAEKDPRKPRQAQPSVGPGIKAA